VLNTVDQHAQYRRFLCSRCKLKLKDWVQLWQHKGLGCIGLSFVADSLNTSALPNNQGRVYSLTWSLTNDRMLTVIRLPSPCRRNEIRELPLIYVLIGRLLVDLCLQPLPKLLSDSRIVRLRSRARNPRESCEILAVKFLPFL